LSVFISQGIAMPDDEIVKLDMQDDFAGKLGASRPVQAITELIWNGLDAEASLVKVTAEVDQLKLNSVTIRDNGHGMSRADAVKLFRNLGGSWKKVKIFQKMGCAACTERRGKADSAHWQSAGLQNGPLLGGTTRANLRHSL
jgi:hypothetical protein